MSFWRLYYHLTWSTKNRLPLIDEQIEQAVYAFIVKKSSELGGFIYAVNGISDHIHLVVAIPASMSIAEYVKNVKGASSHYINHKLMPESTFRWQRGYGVLSVGERQKLIPIEYVNHQKDHHQSQSTISWLERSSDIEEGPVELIAQTGSSIQEAVALYSTGDAIPF